MEKENLEKKQLRRITVYTSPNLKKDMESFKKEKGFKSLSSMLSTAFLILKQVLGSGSSKPYGERLEEKLDRIEKRLEEIHIEKDLLDKDEKIIDKEFEGFSIDNIPDYNKISKKIIKLIQEFDGIKDFVLMQHLRKEYSEGILWAVLVKLKEEKKIKLKDGVWKIN